ncbi:MAG TPA: valine--tRNA ligase, partial [Clostridia bacterium]|nr:valine--tRNA ligase [Clostridia bacterium]
ETVGAKYELVTQGRNLRREGNIPASKKVKYILKPANYLPPYEVETLKLLLNAESLELNPDYQAERGTPVVHSPIGELYLPLGGLVDVAAEKARLTKELEKAQTETTKAEQRLSNPAFTQKAPPHVLEEHQQRLADWRAKVVQIQSLLQRLG